MYYDLSALATGINCRKTKEVALIVNTGVNIIVQYFYFYIQENIFIVPNISFIHLKLSWI